MYRQEIDISPHKEATFNSPKLRTLAELPTPLAELLAAIPRRKASDMAQTKTAMPDQQL